MIARVVMIASLLVAQPAVQVEPNVVFVCEHGAAKSVIATAYFNKIAAERGLHARAVYRGVNPQADLSVAALKGLRDEGLTVPDQKPSPITQADVDRATVMFAIGCTLVPAENSIPTARMILRGLLSVGRGAVKVDGNAPSLVGGVATG